MIFDPCQHQINHVLIKAGKEIRKLQNEIRKLSGLDEFPEEKNITKIHEEVATILGVRAILISSRVADHLPSPGEMKDKNEKPFIPRKDCPKCGTKNSLILVSLCPSCNDSEGGKYHSAWKCSHTDCSYIDKHEEFFAQRLNMEYPEVELGSGTKKELGIKTLTNEGLK